MMSSAFQNIMLLKKPLKIIQNSTPMMLSTEWALLKLNGRISQSKHAIPGTKGLETNVNKAGPDPSQNLRVRRSTS